MFRRIVVPVGVVLLIAAPAIVVALQDPAPKTVWNGIYTEKQAQRGEQVFKSECSYCHRDDLSGGFFDNGIGRAPALAGPRAFDSSFTERWKDQTLAEMVATVASTMPQQKPASLTVQAYVDVVSYLLSKNNVPAGNMELPVDVDALGQLLITQKN
jgi:quinoprotein glucose dehydrogenase